MADETVEFEDEEYEDDPEDFDDPDLYDDSYDYDEDFHQGAADLADRISLKRIEGIRTDLQDITEVEYRALRLERVVLVGIGSSKLTDAEVERSFTELQLLAETAGSNVLAAIMQTRSTPDPATFLGRGKVTELAEVVAHVEADTVICDGELTAAQLRNLEDRVNVKVIDRTALILDIFAQHAKSKEGKAQVELAQLTYLRQRLRGWGTSLSRQVGGRAASGAGIGGRGPGETKIETDRRRIASRISRLRAQLKQMKAAREVKRASRVRSKIPSVAIVGYTNAGKSSLLNALTNASVLVDNSLFATLDPITRRTETASGREYTLTDTVGFIRRLPTDLVESFASTLEESLNADLLVHVVDGSDPDPAGQIAAVREVLADIEAASIPELIVVNKIDLVDESVRVELRSRFPDAILVSVGTGEGIDTLLTRIDERLPELDDRVEVLLPFDRGDLLDRIHRHGRVESLDHTEEGTRVVAYVNKTLSGFLETYLVQPKSQ
ncbi:MAG: GTPase HflX [Propionibacteriaceae bacterium]|jgi:GTP-binding protein HflX|nr:GTPase HflX [Propionibacteriaceae bacterium]